MEKKYNINDIFDSVQPQVHYQIRDIINKLRYEKNAALTNLEQQSEMVISSAKHGLKIDNTPENPFLAVVQLNNALLAAKALQDDGQEFISLDSTQNLAEQLTALVPLKPTVLINIMDVSGSVASCAETLARSRQAVKDYQNDFLHNHLEGVEQVYIQYTDRPKELTADVFHEKEIPMGGSIVSSAFKLAAQIIDARYDTTKQNIYLSFTSDGGYWRDERQDLIDTLNALMPNVKNLHYSNIPDGRENDEIGPVFDNLASQYPEKYTKVIVDASVPVNKAPIPM
jgi:hypothetical protein